MIQFCRISQNFLITNTIQINNNKYIKRSYTSVCDIYNNNGKPLAEKYVQEQLTFLHPRWKYDKIKQEISRDFYFTKKITVQNTTNLLYGVKACYSFITTLNNLCINNDHWIYFLSMTPHRNTIHVILKTPSRNGLTPPDLHLALHLDSFMRASFSHTID